MKKLITILILTLLTSSLLRAQTGIKVGFKGGYSMATQYGITPANLPYDIQSEFTGGFAGGGFLYFPITEAFSVQQEFLYVNKGSTQKVALEQGGLAISTVTNYQINYFELPFVFRYTFARFGNVALFGNTGFAVSVMLDGDYEMTGTIDMGGGKVPLPGSSGNMDGVDEFDYSFLYGAGVDFKLFKQDCYFEYRFTIGWNTLMLPTGDPDEPSALKNQAYNFCLGIVL